ncbi:MAG: VWA domain-containing protein [Saprospiraceae bacterium]|nr:VWA domain-containing protein [Saprospiraceae bacterium]
MSNNFSKFENFGLIADKNKRKAWAKAIFDELKQQPSKTKIEVFDTEIDSFSGVIQQILDNKTMRTLCQNDADLAQEITQEILEFINKSKKDFNQNNPYSIERELLEQFNALSHLQFNTAISEKKDVLRPYFDELNTLYQEIDIDFYEKEFDLIRNNTQDEETQNNHAQNNHNFDSLKEHLLDKWKGLLLKKEISYQLNIIDEKRGYFCEELYHQIEELNRLKSLLAPITNELGRFWDMSKGDWQHVNFDLLTQYANLLNQDEALIQLANMLGRMHEAEKEYEEKNFANTAIKSEWKAPHAHKSELVGIRESDDLSSLLPSETALLSEPIIQTIFFKKFVEKKLQTFDYQSKTFSVSDKGIKGKHLKEKQKGAIIICVDTSGSMLGAPERVAKTLCFALLKLALNQNRKCYLISFSTEIKTLNLTDLNNSMAALLEFLAMSFRGGTDATPSVYAALKQLETEDYKKADVLMISDFVMPKFAPELSAEIQKARNNQTKFHSLVIGNSSNKNVIADFDNNWVYDPNNRKSMITFVEHLKKI